MSVIREERNQSWRKLWDAMVYEGLSANETDAWNIYSSQVQPLEGKIQKQRAQYFKLLASKYPIPTEAAEWLMEAVNAKCNEDERMNNEAVNFVMKLTRLKK